MGTKTVFQPIKPDPSGEPNSFVPDGPPVVTDTRDLSDAAAEALSRLADHCQALYDAGYNFAGRNFQIDPVSLQNVNGAATLALVSQATGQPWPATFVWIASDNTTMPVPDAPTMIGFAASVANHVTTLILTNRALKDAIAVLPDVASCDAFDVTQGWPKN